MPLPFLDRTDAGAQLARTLAAHKLTCPIVLALPRGGVPVGLQVALARDAPLEVFVVRKIGAPDRPEAGIGAIAEGGSGFMDSLAVRALGLSDQDVARLVRRERRELDRRVERYRNGRPLPELVGRDVILVDDGLATGVTAEAALRALRAHRARLLLLAAPVSAPATAERMRQIADRVVCVAEPADFHAVSQFYRRFKQTTDEEVLDLLARAPGRTGAST